MIQKSSGLGLVEKLWSTKSANAKALMDALKKIWNPIHGLEARRIDENLFSFQFYHWKDNAIILEGQSKHFDCHIMCFSDIQEDGKVAEMQVHSLPIWAGDLQFTL